MVLVLLLYHITELVKQLILIYLHFSNKHFYCYDPLSPSLLVP